MLNDSDTIKSMLKEKEILAAADIIVPFALQGRGRIDPDEFSLISNMVEGKISFEEIPADILSGCVPVRFTNFLPHGRTTIEIRVNIISGDAFRCY